MEIDSRPSDALALAVRVHVPIFVDESVMEMAAAEPEQSVEGGDMPEEEMDEGRLEVFKDFVDSLDLGAMDEDEEEEEEEEEDADEDQAEE
jgi:hypothetical protein